MESAASYARWQVVEFVAGDPGAMPPVPDIGILPVEPVTVAQLGDHLRVDDAAATDDLTQLIQTARDLAERWTGRSIIRQQILVHWDTIPGVPEQWWAGVRDGIERRRMAGAIELPRSAPLISVDRFSVYDNADVRTDADLSIFIIDRNNPNRNGRIALRIGQTWPLWYRPVNGIEVLLTAGWTPGATPAAMKRAILMLAGWLYTNRGDVDPDTAIEGAGVGVTLSPFRMQRV